MNISTLPETNLRRHIGVEVEAIQDFYDGKEGGTPYPAGRVDTGFASLDALLHGLKPGDLSVVAGAPLMGVTAFVCNVAAFVATERKLPVFVAPLHQGISAHVRHLVGTIGHLSSERVATALYSDDEWQHLVFALEKISGGGAMHVDDRCFAVDDAVAKATEIAGGQPPESPLGLIVIDGLPMLATSENMADRTAELSAICRKLKILARTLGVPVILTTNLNRRLDDRGNKRPMLGDLRDCGALADIADVVMLLYRDEIYNPDTLDRGVAEVIVAKNSLLRLGTARVGYMSDHNLFYNLPPGE